MLRGQVMSGAWTPTSKAKSGAMFQAGVVVDLGDQPTAMSIALHTSLAVKYLATSAKQVVTGKKQTVNGKLQSM